MSPKQHKLLSVVSIIAAVVVAVIAVLGIVWSAGSVRAQSTGAIRELQETTADHENRLRAVESIMVETYTIVSRIDQRMDREHPK